VIDFEALVEEGVVAPDDLKLFTFVESAEEAWEMVCAYYAERERE
jgi:predicted Rossmann-fold nucleotide-binding protein